MGENITLTASDGHRLGAYMVRPDGMPKGAIVVGQEIFGVNHHIRAVCDRFAALGYVAIAPALFDRTERDFQTGYTPEEVARARGMIAQPDFDAMLRDVDAAISEAAKFGPVGIVGFCLGGSLAFLSATRLSGIKAAVGYYGSRIAATADEVPKVPVQLHFGEKDAGIPLADVEVIKARRPEVETFVYAGAQHGFNCDERASYDASSAATAWHRTLAFLDTHAR